MDYTNPFSSNSPGFVNLLTRQVVNESYSHTIDLESSEIPSFSTQTSDDPTLGVDDTKERRKWLSKEDVVLISAWLNTSKDPVVSNEQKAGAFWKRIEAFYNSSPQLVGMRPRLLGQCKQRWGRINDQVCKFVGCYEAALKEQSSGQNDNDLMKAAHDIFFNDYKLKFTLDHAWRELRHDQKWSSTTYVKDGGKDKRRKVSQEEGSGSYDVPQARPAGVKASKGVKDKRSGKEEPLAQLQNMWDIKKMDLEMKDKLSKRKLLDHLLAKTEALSELEEALKNQLITEMLS